MKLLLRFQILVVILLLAQDGQAQNSFPVIRDTLSRDSCRCSCESAYYPGGNTLFTDSLVKITTQKVKPSVSGSIFVRFTITETGELVDPEIIKSIDPRFEAVLLKNLVRMGKWVPICKYTVDPGFDDCCEREPGRVTMQMRISITAE
jgi:hypothetical protein